MRRAGAEDFYRSYVSSGRRTGIAHGLPTADGGIESVLQGRPGVTFVYPTGGKQAIGWAKASLTHAIVPPL